jgi:hypothetical protein
MRTLYLTEASETRLNFLQSYEIGLLASLLRRLAETLALN